MALGRFELESEYVPAGDQPAAIEGLTKGVLDGKREQVLLGVTGSGKTFTMANVIRNVGRPALIMAHNKTLAAQLFSEFRTLFPRNAVEYFVSYYDYYQPEAYIPRSDVYIEKDASVNEQIDKMRNSATRSLLVRDDVIIVASVSCIYGLGSPDAYDEMAVPLVRGQIVDRDEILRSLTTIQYQRNNYDLKRGSFRVRGDVVEVFPAYEEDRIVRIEFFDDEIESLVEVDPLRGEVLGEPDSLTIFPSSHYITPADRMKRAIVSIREELAERLEFLRSKAKLLEAQRLEQRTRYDLEILEENGFCNGIENYSRHLDGRSEGEPPATLINYFPKDYLLFIDESHQTVPQTGAMYRGDRSRKTSLVEHGFRLPSALDNRPLRFEEFEKLIGQAIFVSATPGPYELERVGGRRVEQIIRPTGLTEPAIDVRPAEGQVDDLLSEIKERVERGERVLVTTLTKRMAEELTDYYTSVGLKVKYLHSDIKTIERTEIICELRAGVFDTLIGINLLREGLDIPEVSLVAILDADREGFLRSTTSLVQTCGRASRNVNGTVILYAAGETRSMRGAMDETNRRREIQEAYNRREGITPASIRKGINPIMEAVSDSDYVTVSKVSEAAGFNDLVHIRKAIKKVRGEMLEAARDLEFEKAADLRDRMIELEKLDLKYR
jgi:excinuclease ABC subunit B